MENCDTLMNIIAMLQFTQSHRPIIGSKQNLMFYICICKSMDYELEEKLYHDYSVCEHTMSICTHNYLRTYPYIPIL